MKDTRIDDQRVREVRMVLAFLEGELCRWRDDAEVSAVDVPSASEYHKGRARGLFEALGLVERMDVAARRLTAKKRAGR